MADLFASNRMIDLILLLMLVEVLGLTAWRRRTGRGLELVALLPNLLAGAFLLLALRGALTAAAWPWIAAALAAALLAHLTDLRRRYRDGEKSRP